MATILRKEPTYTSLVTFSTGKIKSIQRGSGSGQGTVVVSIATVDPSKCTVSVYGADLAFLGTATNQKGNQPTFAGLTSTQVSIGNVGQVTTGGVAVNASFWFEIVEYE